MSIPKDELNIPDFLPLLTSQLRLNRLLPAVLDISLELTGAERAFIMIYDQQGQLSIKAARNSKKEDLPDFDFQGSTSIIRKVVDEKQPLYLPQLQATAFATAESIRSHHLRSAICIPLVQHHSGETARSRLTGVLYIDSSSPANPLHEQHLQILKTLSNHVSILIENARLFEELAAKNEELGRKNQQIEQLNRRLEERVESQAENIAGMKSLLRETQRELGHVYGFGNIVGKCDHMLKVFKILEKVVRTDASVLILGESGTGKEMIAKYIHYNGPRAEKPMVSVNCSALSEPLLESELFGHRKGAFTGAIENKIGLFQLADGGTLFLDEVGDTSPEMQKKLLRVLQDGEVRPIGSKDTYKTDVRIVAATNKNLKDLIREEEFREDLYFRLNVINISIPALRDRREDIPLLIDYFTHKISGELKRPLKSPSERLLKRFMEYDWPGNVRELENELRRAFILESEYQPDLLLSATSQDSNEVTMAHAEKAAILRALEAAHGNRKKAAELLGIPRSSFYEKLGKYKIF